MARRRQRTARLRPLFRRGLRIARRPRSRVPPGWVLATVSRDSEARQAAWPFIETATPSMSGVVLATEASAGEPAERRVMSQLRLALVVAMLVGLTGGIACS